MAAKKELPRIIVIAGPNGVGKTTFARAFLPETGIEEFLNADLLASGLTPLNPQASVFAAGRLLLERWHDLEARAISFGFETTLSGRTYATMLKAARQRGYTIELHYLWVPTVTICLRRVRNRVKKGGHNVPESDVRRRYPASIRNFFSLYLPLADEAALWDVSVDPSGEVAVWDNQNPTIYDQQNYERIKSQSANE